MLLSDYSNRIRLSYRTRPHGSANLHNERIGDTTIVSLSTVVINRMIPGKQKDF